MNAPRTHRGELTLAQGFPTRATLADGWEEAAKPGDESQVIAEPRG